ncbi:MAG TPA: hypothetical protein VES67_15005 [Vicinamibacterales bacterium]|nr:hypothetical protein [Vicinamibacterales bacterium]
MSAERETARSLEEALRDALESFFLADRGTLQAETYQTIFIGKGARKGREIADDLTKRVSADELAQYLYFSVGGADGSEAAWILENTPIAYAVMVDYSQAACDLARVKSQSISASLGKSFKTICGDATQRLGEALAFSRDWRTRGCVSGIVVSAQSVLHELPFRSPGFKMSTYFGQIFAGWANAFLYCREPCQPQNWPSPVQMKLRDLSGGTLAGVARLIKSQLSGFAGSITEVPDDYVEMDAALALETLFKVLYFLDSDFEYEMGERLTSFEPEVVRNQLQMYLGPNSVRVDYIMSDHFEREYRRLVVGVRDPATGQELGMPNSFVRIVGERKDHPVTKDVRKIRDTTNLGFTIDAGMFHGRVDELRRIREWLSQSPPRAWLIRGLAGQGKSEVARRYAIDAVASVSTDVIGVSLYHSSGVDDVIERIAAPIFGAIPQPTQERVRRILEFCRSKELLLIVDGLEREQDTRDGPPGAGSVARGPLQDLLYGLMGPESKARLLLTSQLDVVGIDPLGRLRTEMLLPLSPTDGINLLRVPGGKEADELLKSVSVALEGHPLSLTAAQRIIRAFGAEDLLGLVAKVSGDAKVRRILRRYRDSLSREALTLVRVVSACAGSISDATMQMVLTTGLTAPLNKASFDSAKKECEGVLWNDERGRLDVHPIVRAVFQEEWLESQQKQARRVHKKLAELFERHANEALKRPNPTSAELEPVLGAMHHRLSRGEVLAASLMFWRMMKAGGNFHIVHTLGVWSFLRDAGLLFLRDRDPDQLARDLGPSGACPLLSNISAAELALAHPENALVWAGRARDIAAMAASKTKPKDVATRTSLWSLAQNAGQICINAYGWLGLLGDAETEADRGVTFAEKSRAKPAVTTLGSVPEVLVAWRAALWAASYAYSARGRLKLWKGLYTSALVDMEHAVNVFADVSQELKMESLVAWQGMDHVECLLLLDRDKNRRRALEVHTKNLKWCEERNRRDRTLRLVIERAMLERLDGRDGKAFDLLSSVRDQFAVVEDVELRIHLHLELARCHLTFGGREQATAAARVALDFATRKGHVLAMADALALAAEAEPQVEARRNDIRDLSEIVDGRGYGRRKSDLEMLRAGRRPVLEIGV